MSAFHDEEILKELLNRTDKICLIYDLELHELRYMNRGAQLLLNNRNIDAPGSPTDILNFIHPDDRELIQRRYQELISGAELKKIEFRVMLPDGTERNILLFPQLLTDGQGNTCAACIAEDVTLENENAENLHKFASKKNSVLEILSHDLAGSLGIIQSLAGLLEETLQDSRNEEAATMIRIIRRSSTASLQMIRDFVQQEFLESANAGLVKKRVDLVVKLREIMEQYKEGEMLLKKEIKLFAPDKPVFVHMDEDKFMQVINNLVSNSIKFTHDGGLITVQVEEKEDTALIIVKDNGIGIPLKYHDKLFEKFTPARREGLKGEPSTGLGMSIIKTIVNWHQGRIWFDSEPGAGTTFYIEIPKN